jgi:hypothetical protein
MDNTLPRPKPTTLIQVCCIGTCRGRNLTRRKIPVFFPKSPPRSLTNDCKTIKISDYIGKIRRRSMSRNYVPRNLGNYSTPILTSRCVLFKIHFSNVLKIIISQSTQYISNSTATISKRTHVWFLSTRDLKLSFILCVLISIIKFAKHGEVSKSRRWQKDDDRC